MRRHGMVVAGVAGLLVYASGVGPAAQLPGQPRGSAGQTVTPVFEGWYPNRDGTVSLSFGYYNRNTEEAVDIPIGPDNFLEPGPGNQGQPTHFEPGRHWGVFAVTVPADPADQTIVWTLNVRGESNAIPGTLRRNWHIDALEGEAGSGNTPPVLKFDVEGPEGTGPAGLTVGPRSTPAGAPLPITVWARDDGRESGSVMRDGESAAPVTLTWFEHQGPGRVAFSESEIDVPAAGGSATTSATFDEPGDYVLRVRANDASGVVGAGHAQCCWTNGFVKVTVTR